MIKDDTFDFFFHESIVPMILYDPVTLKILDVNKAAVSLYGYRQSYFQEMLITDLHPQREVQRLLQYIEANATLTKRKGCFTHIKSDGSSIDVEIISHMIIFGDEKPLRLAQIHDITQNVKKMDIAELTNEFLKIYFNNFPLAIWILDLSETLQIRNKSMINTNLAFYAILKDNPTLLNKLLKSINVIYFNEASVKLFGGREEAKFKSEIGTCFNISDKDVQSQFLEKILGTKEFEFEAQSETLQKLPIYMKLKWFVIQGHEAKYDRVLVSIIDITQLWETRIETEKLEKRIKALFDRTVISDFEDTDLGMALINKELGFIETNKSFMKLLGYNNEEFNGITMAELVIPSEQTGFKTKMKELFSGVVGSLDIEEQFICKNKGVLWCRVNISLVQNKFEETVYGVVLITDITQKKKEEIEHNNIFEENKRMRNQLHTLSKGLFETLEKEKKQISRELHDEIGQVLTAIKIEMQSTQRVSKNEKVLDNMAEGIKLVEHAIKEVRDLSFNIRPSILDDIGLVSAIRWHVLRQTERMNIKTNIIADVFSKRFSSEIEITCYRIVQEALTNIIRHANAKNISVTIKEETDKLLLTIEDDGVGFDLEKVIQNAREGKSLGVIGMIERVELIGGTININTSSIENRTEINVEFPLI